MALYRRALSYGIVRFLHMRQHRRATRQEKSAGMFPGALVF